MFFFSIATGDLSINVLSVFFYKCFVCRCFQQNDKLMRSFQLLCSERLDHHSSVFFGGKAN